MGTTKRGEAGNKDVPKMDESRVGGEGSKKPCLFSCAVGRPIRFAFAIRGRLTALSFDVPPVLGDVHSLHCLLKALASDSSSSLLNEIYFHI